MASPIAQAIKQICEEKNLSEELVMGAIESALAAAYRKDFGNKNQNIKIEFDPETGSMRAFDVKVVTEDMVLPTEEELAAIAAAPPAPTVAADGSVIPEELKFNPKTMIMLTEARTMKPNAEIAEELRIELEIPAAFGRMAAMTAKQVITQNLREAERQTVFNEYKDRQGTIVTAVVGRREGNLVFVDLGRANALLPEKEQIASEQYRPGARMKFFVNSVGMGHRGPEVIVSRAAADMVKELFRLEIPEVQSGMVEIKAVARDAGARSKIAVVSHNENIDPIGSCIGQRGTRIQTIITELGGEKIDVVEWKEDAMEFIKHALSPAKVKTVTLHEAERVATISVDQDQLSLAIGKAGQNIRLASRLTGWKIMAEEHTGAGEADAAVAVEEVAITPETEPAAVEVAEEPKETASA